MADIRVHKNRKNSQKRTIFRLCNCRLVTTRVWEFSPYEYQNAGGFFPHSSEMTWDILSFWGTGSWIMPPFSAVWLISLFAACLPDLAFITILPKLSQFVFPANFSFLFCLLSSVFTYPSSLVFIRKSDHTSEWQSNNFRMLVVIFVFDLRLAAPVLLTIISSFFFFLTFI